MFKIELRGGEKWLRFTYKYYDIKQFIKLHNLNNLERHWRKLMLTDMKLLSSQALWSIFSDVKASGSPGMEFISPLLLAKLQIIAGAIHSNWLKEREGEEIRDISGGEELVYTHI